jgi:hypothetical protein
MYINAFDGIIPDENNYDFKGDRFGSDAIILSSTSPYFQ